MYEFSGSAKVRKKLKKTLGISSNSLSHHLRILIQNALIKNYYAKREGFEEYSFYNVTLLSKEFIDNMFKIITAIPETPAPFYRPSIEAIREGLTGAVAGDVKIVLTEDFIDPLLLRKRVLRTIEEIGARAEDASQSYAIPQIIHR